MNEKSATESHAAIYATWYNDLVRVARDHGYALAIHGSGVRDLDLIAVPWVESVSAPETLAEAIRSHIGGYLSPTDESPTPRPHGRLTWAIHVGYEKAYIDLSIFTTEDNDG